jgi:hypothetical protein
MLKIYIINLLIKIYVWTIRLRNIITDKSLHNKISSKNLHGQLFIKFSMYRKRINILKIKLAAFYIYSIFYALIVENLPVPTNKIVLWSNPQV